MATTGTPLRTSLDARELRAWRGLLHVHATLVKALDAEMAAAHGIGITAYEVLLHLADAPEHRMRMYDLASSVLLSRSGLTRLVDRLERDGLLERESCQSDARGAFAVLTDAGRRKLEAARPTHLAGVRRHFLDALSPEEQELLGDAWDKVLPAGAAAAPPPPCG